MTQQEYWNAVGMSKYYSHMYYVKSSPVISDAEFDALVAQIEQAEMTHPDWTLPDSPTQKVGSDLSDNGRRSIAHRTPMLSCQKAQTVEAVDKWLVKIRPNIRRDLGRFLLMWKYDGISCSLVYQDGKLIEASTRGEDGLIGQDILDHMTDPLEGIDFEGEESETKDWFTSEEETNIDCAGETDDVETAPAAPEVTAADLEAAVKACEERRSVIEQEAREKAVTGLKLSQTGNKATTDNVIPAESAEIAESSNKQSKALKIGAAIVGVLVIAVCGITALAASVFLAPVLVGAFKG